MSGTRGGFTLVELLVALALTAVVAAASIAALNLFVEADAATAQRLERTTGAHRAMFLLRRDVTDATALTVSADACIATQRDGSVVGYAIGCGGTELFRYAGDAASVASLVDVTIKFAIAAPSYSARGHLRDSDYRAPAVLQGAARIQLVPIAPAGAPVGLTIEIQTRAGALQRSVALSVPLCENHRASL